MVDEQEKLNYFVKDKNLNVVINGFSASQGEIENKIFFNRAGNIKAFD